MRKYIGIVLCLIFVASLFTACSNGTNGQVTEDTSLEPIKIGFIGPLTGGAAVWGLNAKKGIEIALADINTEGGVNGRKVEVIFEDSQALPKEGSTAIQKLVNIDDVQAIIGGIASSVTLGIAPIAESKEVVLISPGSSSPRVTNAGEYTFRTWPSDAFQGIFLGELAYNELGYRKVATLYVNNDYGVGVKDAFAQKFKVLGGKVTAVESHEQEVGDFRSQLTKLTETNPDALFLPSYPAEMAIAVQQARELGYDGPIFGPETFEDPQIPDVAGNAAEGIIYTKPLVETSDDFKRKHLEMHGEEPGIVSENAYDALMLIVETMKQGATTGKEIKDGLHKIGQNYKGASGTITFDEKGDIFKPYQVMIIQNGEFVKQGEQAELKGTLKVGFIGPLTGDAAAYGLPIQKVLNLATEEINSQGGINGKALEIIYEDAKCTGKEAATAAQKLVNIDKVNYILGGLCSGETLGAAPVTEKGKVILFSAGSGSPDITNAGDYVFRNFPSDASSGSKVARTAYEMGYETVSIIAENTDYAQAVKNVFVNAYEGNVLTDESYDSEGMDFRTQILKMKSKNPDAIYVLSQTPAKFGIVLQQIDELGLDVPLFTNEFAAAGDILSDYGEYIEGAIYAEPAFDENAPRAKALLDKLNAKYGDLTGSLPPVYLATQYDAIYLMKEAMEAVGENPEDLKEYLYNVKDRKGTVGTLTIDSNGDPEFEYVVRVIENNEPTVMA